MWLVRFCSLYTCLFVTLTTLGREKENEYIINSVSNINRNLNNINNQIIDINSNLNINNNNISDIYKLFN